MFQYSLGRMLSLKWNSALKLDTSFYSPAKQVDTPRRFMLDAFKVSGEIATPADLDCVSVPSPSIRKRLCLLRHRMLRRAIPEISKVTESSHAFSKKVLTSPDNVYLDGYWQSEKYFRSIRDTILRDFTLREPLNESNLRVLSQIKQKNSVAVHVRRGDYVTNPAANSFHGVCPPEYYANAFQIIQSRISDPHYFLFSDDPGWVRENLIPDSPFTVVESNSTDLAHYDLWLMKHCRNFIIANSTFSWWGAWLSEIRNKTVICPARWFKAEDINTRDLVPEGWTCI